MQIMMKKTNYVMLLLCKMTLCLIPLWTSRFKIILRRNRWYSSTWKRSCQSNDVWPPWLIIFVSL